MQQFLKKEPIPKLTYIDKKTFPLFGGSIVVTLFFLLILPFQVANISNEKEKLLKKNMTLEEDMWQINKEFDHLNSQIKQDKDAIKKLEEENRILKKEIKLESKTIKLNFHNIDEVSDELLNIVSTGWNILALDTSGSMSSFYDSRKSEILSIIENSKNIRVVAFAQSAMEIELHSLPGIQNNLQLKKQIGSGTNIKSTFSIIKDIFNNLPVNIGRVNIICVTDSGVSKEDLAEMYLINQSVNFYVILVQD